MGRLLVVFAVASAGMCVVWGATGSNNVAPIQQCSGQNFENLKERVTLTRCTKSRCKLRKGSETTVTIRFTPTTKIKDLTTEVNAAIMGVPLPFIGVTGTSACGLISKADSGKTVPCPLEPNQEYIYTKTIPVETFYPTIQHLVVHWALKNENDDVVCFEVPAAILDAKVKKN